MCFFDQHVFSCGDYKWGYFRQHCNREYRTGETCGMKLIMSTNKLNEKCRLCEKMDVKARRIKAESDRVARWSAEPQRFSASISRSREIIQQLECELRNLLAEKERRATTLNH